MEKNKEYTQKEVVEITGISNDLLRVYEKEFNLNISRTPGGHRRYNEEDIKNLVSIRKKIHEQNWSYKQVRSWRNGEEMSPVLHDQQITSNLEKMMSDQKELIQDLATKLEQSIHLQIAMAQQIGDLKHDKQKLEQIVEKRNQDLIQTLIDEKRKDREENKSPKTFIQRLFKQK
ncbi:MerR family transcriptional regulator [Bacillus thuringiensis]|uniref:MerR family transcriptional regulator n=1 Tax=Bacillus thuringiensis TaxID=1428 RepID=UPI0011A51827|nr:MerR family transcriptional regulator [Bacillus thuringiensis]